MDVRLKMRNLEGVERCILVVRFWLRAFGLEIWSNREAELNIFCFVLKFLGHTILFYRDESI